MIKRSFAPPEVRLKALVARERLMLKTLEEGRKNLDNPPPIYTDIAIQQMDGNIAFSPKSCRRRSPASRTRRCWRISRRPTRRSWTRDAYKTFLQKDLKPRSKGRARSALTRSKKKYRTDEMVDASLDRLLAIAEADLARNTEAFNKTASEIAPGKPAKQRCAGLVGPSRAVEAAGVSQASLDNLRQFITAHHLVTIPGTTTAKVVESPPFMRALSTASMDAPGPFETKATEAYYNVTLPDPAWPKARVESYMHAWYFPQIINVSINEVYPGHYTPFLYGPQFPSKIRKIFGAGSNSEGWAHYCEQMMLDEALRRATPGAARTAAGRAARDVRFIAGIELNTNQITVEQAQTLFEEKAYQSHLSRWPRPAAAHRTHLRLLHAGQADDPEAARRLQGEAGRRFTLQDFHDRFLKLGPLPLPLIRRAMLGESATRCRQRSPQRSRARTLVGRSANQLLLRVSREAHVAHGRQSRPEPPTWSATSRPVSCARRVSNVPSHCRKMPGQWADASSGRFTPSICSRTCSSSCAINSTGCSASNSSTVASRLAPDRWIVVSARRPARADVARSSSRIDTRKSPRRPSA
jgi:hypothetical protein